MKSCDFLPGIIVIMISRLSCWFVLLFWLDWPQSLPAASWCAVLIVSHPVSSTFPPNPLPSFLPCYSLYLFFFTQLSFLNPCLWVHLILFTSAYHCQTSPSSGPPLIPHSLPFHSSLNSVNSSDSRGSSGSHSHSPSSSSSSSSSHHLFHHHHPRHRYRSSTLPQQAPARLSSISSHDSGFISSSQDQYTSSKSSSPMPAETKVRKTLSCPHFIIITLDPSTVCTHGWDKTIKPHMLYDLQVILVQVRENPSSATHTALLSHIFQTTMRGSYLAAVRVCDHGEVISLLLL